ncbi:zinc knuckle CX2CX4HX4C containing protein [Tanacetum coccineum]
MEVEGDEEEVDDDVMDVDEDFNVVKRKKERKILAGGSAKDQPNVNYNFRTLVADPVFDGVNISIPRKVVEKVSTRFEHTLYGYFIGKRMAFSVVEYYARNNWAKHGLKRIMMNSKGLFFFNFDSRAGLEAVLEGGPWLIRKSLIILKKWSMDTRLLKEELTRIPIWVKLHDVPIQVFEEDGISLIATFIGKPVMLDSYTSSMCNDSWGRSSFARCLIEVNSEADLVDVVTIGIPSLSEDDFTKETIRVEYEWRPPRCDTCKIFGHVHDYCPKKVVSPPIVATSNVVTPNAEKTNDGFQTVGKKKKRKGKSKSTNGGQFTGPSVKHNVRYEPKATTSAPKKGTTYVGYTSQSTPMLKTTGNSSKKDNLSMSNSFSALNEEEEEDENMWKLCCLHAGCDCANELPRGPDVEVDPNARFCLNVIGAGRFAYVAAGAGSIAVSVVLPGTGLIGTKMARRAGSIDEFEYTKFSLFHFDYKCFCDRKKEHIVFFWFVNEMDTLGIRRSKEWKDKLPNVVLKAEEIVYSKANSEVIFDEEKLESS